MCVCIRCLQLAAFATEIEDNSTIPIFNTHLAVFNVMLHFLYSDKLLFHWCDHHMDLIHAADQFGCSLLKHTIEADVHASLHGCDPLKLANVIYYLAECLEGVEQLQGWVKLSKSAELLSELVVRLKPTASASRDGQTEDNVNEASILCLQKCSAI